MPQTQGQEQSPQKPQEITLDEWDERVRSNYSIPQKLWRAMAEQESGNDVNAVSPTGVRGRRQVTKATARQYGYNRDDPFEEAAASGKHLRTLYDGLSHIEGDDARWWGALAQYYGGGDAIDRDGNLSERSLDGISNPKEHVNRVARRIRDMEETPGSVIRNPQPTTPAPQYDERGRRKIGARDVGITPVEWQDGKVYDLTSGKFVEPTSAQTPAPQSVSTPLRTLRQDKSKGTPQNELRSLRPGAPYRQPSDDDLLLAGDVGGWARRGAERAAMMISPEVTERVRKMEEFEKRPWTEQVRERAYDAEARGGQALSTLARRAVGTALGGVQALQGGKFEVVDVRPESWKRWEDERARELAERREAFRPSFGADVSEGIIEASGPAAAATGLTMATGGSLPAAMGVGGGMSALQADWEKDPTRAAAQTVLGAVAPVVGGKAGAALVGPIASRVSSAAGQAGLRAIGEMVGGGTGNVLQSGAEQLAFDGKLNEGELARQGVIGVGLSAPGALTSLRRGAAAPEPTTSRGAMEIVGDPNIRAMGPVADEAAIRARVGRQEATEAFRARRAQARQADEANEADETETPTVVHPDPQIDRKPVIAKTGDGRVIVPNPNNKYGVSVVKDRSGDPAEHKFSSTQANLPEDIAGEIKAFGRRIPDSDLADNGREDTPHITLKYGLHGWDPKIAEQALAGEGPIKVRLGKTSLFQNDDADVVKVDIDSPDLHRLNQKIADAHPNTETHPTYEPHATIAYVRPGQGGKYAGDSFLEGKTITLDRITFAGRDGKQIEIPLTGAKKATTPAEVAGEPVSPRWLNAQRRQAAKLLGLDPDQVPLADETAPQNLQNPQAKPAMPGRSATKPKLVADAEQRLRDVVTGKVAGSGGQAVFDMAVVAGWKAYRVGVDFGAWSAEVVKEAGERVRPHLRAAWDAIQADYKQMEREATTPRQASTRVPLRADVRALAEDSIRRGKMIQAAELKNLGLPYDLDYHGGKIERPMSLPIDDIVLGRDDLQPDRLLKLAEVMEKSGLPVGSDVDPITVSQNPKTGKWAASDGNTRIAMLKLAGYKGNVNVTAEVSEAPARRRSSGTYMGSGLGALQPLFEGANRTPPKPGAPEAPGRRQRFFETVGAAQTLGQLGSPGFVMRNIIGHASHGAQEMIVRGVGGILDKAASFLTGKRTVGGFGNPLEFAREVGKFTQDYKAGVKAAREAIRKGEPLPGSRLADMPDPETLTAFGRKLQKILTYINEVPDAGNWNAHFQASLRDQASVFASARNKPSASKSIQRVDEIIERAWAEADHASMRDKNFVSDSLRRLKKFLNTTTRPLTGTDKFGLGDFVVKYVQVPGSLVKKGIEYSPVGIFEAGYHALKGDQRRAVQSLSRVITGSTTGVGVGAALGALGILVGPERDKGQLSQLEREEGVRGYSINMSALKRLAGGGWDDPESRKLQAGDQLVTIDFLQPWALQASTGAAVYDLYSKGQLSAGSGAKATGEAVYNSLAKALDVMGDQSVLKNLGRYMSRVTGETTTEKFVNFFKAVGLDIPSSFVPSLARQTRQVLDPYERDTRPEDPEDFVGEATNRALAQLPGVSQTYPTRPSVLTGGPKKTAIGDYSMPVRGLRQVSPAPFTTYTPSDVAQETGRLTDAGFKVAFTMPKRTPGERTSDLRQREERFADAFSSQAPKLLNHPFYRLANDEAKAEALNDLAKQLRAATRKTIDAKTVDEIIDRAGDRVENRRDKRLK